MTESKYLENERTIFSLDTDSVDHVRHNIGFIIYIVIFVICIPYLLVKTKHFEILAAYFPNLDLIATTLGYHGGPFNSFIWQHLYNPADSTLTGYITSNIINLFALLGVTGIIAYYAFTEKSMYKGWSKAFIMLPMTYFIPSNIVVYYMNKLGTFLNKFYLSETIMHYLLVVIFGLILVTAFIFGESLMIEKLSPTIAKILKSVY